MGLMAGPDCSNQTTHSILEGYQSGLHLVRERSMGQGRALANYRRGGRRLQHPPTACLLVRTR